ncbi:MAG: hypothetical protein A3B23_02465 [Candidatus Colwellbacteria bacterium RIFCSPLOWO2_01_FULL_48_10]|uniref:Uncharacterized protein n=2 Tax=Bacteria candidate phyla TaxID=1783234 RepID=A0A1F5P2K3_9BACT|nr:MAG: hypothetical protein A2846_01875 [Candidatus Doudnabacteria bacterium RIFCSPHIGHO2_01_FULL_49_9]OGY59746.1 MAG: hypothetical protein A3B23_02465 [Candidatus Colwellbacteria bacterium RIFCSPLOWO2_01_FULL_48_10]
MTVIQPNKYKKSAVRLIAPLGFLVLVLLGAEVATYAQMVNLQHDAGVLSARAGELRVENAELKNDFYAITDQKNLDRLAKERGLVQDKNPKWVFASQL